MSARRDRRRRSTWIALTSAVGALVAVAALSLVAVSSMADSTAGRDAAEDLVGPTRELPWTATALIGVVDTEGALGAMAVAVLEPDGRGGTLLSVSPSADATAGSSASLRPLSAVLEVDGPDEWRAAAEQVTGLSFDVVEVTDHDRFAELIGPLGDLPTVLPFAFTDATTGESYEAGSQVLSGPAAARALTASNATCPDWQLDTSRDAVWSAIADRVGAGIGSLEVEVTYDSRLGPETLDEFLAAFFDAPVAFRALSSVQLEPERVEEQLAPMYADVVGPGWEEAVVVHRRSEALLMFGAVAPARMSAVIDGPTVRLVSGFTTEDTEAIGLSRSDLLLSAVDILGFVQSNVVSVVDMPGGAVPDATRVVVANDSLIDEVWLSFDGVLGEMQVMPATEPIEGVDIEILLGRDYPAALLDRVGAAEASADVEGSDS